MAIKGYKYSGTKHQLVRFFSGTQLANHSNYVCRFKVNSLRRIEPLN